MTYVILQRHMIMNYPEYNKVASRLRYPKLAISAAFGGHDVLWPADCVFDGIGLSRMLDNKPGFEPTAESSERLVAVQKAPKITDCIAGVNTDHTVVSLAGVAAPLTLYTGSMATFFGMTGVINGSDRIRVGMVSCDDPLNPIAEPLFIPVDIRKESLQCSRRRFSQQSDGFSTLALQRGDLPPYISFKMPPRLRAVSTIPVNAMINF